MIKEEIEKFKKGDAVLALRNSYEVPSYFEVMGIQRSENVYSNVLAWLLTSNGSHGLGCLPMRMFLMSVRTAFRRFRKSNEKRVIPFWLEKIGKYKIKSVNVARESPVAGTRRRIDMFCQMIISVQGKDIECRLAIENKIGSCEHDSQTEAYHRFVVKKYGRANSLFVFLTPEPSWRLISGFGEVKCSSLAYVQMNYQMLIDGMLEPLARKADSECAKRYIADLVMAMRYDEKKESVMAISSEERELLKEFVKEQRDFLKRIAVSLEYCQPEEELNLVGLVMSKRDTTKYSLDERDAVAMNRLVLAVVKKYCNDNKDTCDWNALSNAFPAKLQGTFGVVVRESDDLYIDHRDDPTPRYFDDDDEIITLKDGTRVLVCTQWGTGGKSGKRADNFNRFLSHVRKTLNYSIKPHRKDRK